MKRFGWFQGDNEEIDREISFHLEELVQENLRKGLPPPEARRRAKLDFGGREQVKQAVRDASHPTWDFLKINGQAAVRFLRRSPSFSVAICLTLALGIGANSAVFSMLNTVVLRPLVYPHADELVQLTQHDIKGRNTNTFIAPARLEDWNRMSSAFQSISGYYLDNLTETSGSLPEKLTQAYVAPRFLRVMGVSPILGRGFTAEEERFGGPSAAVISASLWHRRFNGDPNVVGKKLHVGRGLLPIIGVMPANFSFPDRTVDLWTVSPPDAPYATSRDSTWFTGIGRLKPGVSLQQGEADLTSVQTQLARQYPRSDDLNVEMAALKRSVVGTADQSIWLLYGAVSLLLLIACSNIAALLLARTADREQEIAVRFSLGASRFTLVMQLLTEVLVLALVGSLLGLAIAAAAGNGFHLLAKSLPRAEEIGIDWTVLMYSLACAVATTFLCGLYPALRGTRGELATTLAEAGRGQTSRRNPLQWCLVGVQVALAVTLLTGAALLLRSLQQLSRVQTGLQPAQVLLFHITGSWSETGDSARLADRINRTLTTLRNMPGVEAASIAAGLPGIVPNNRYEVQFKIDGREPADHKMTADDRTISAGYFATLGIPILQGRDCADGSASNELLVNRSFADKYLAGEPVIGRNVDVDSGASSFAGFSGQIHGIVADARENGPASSPAPTIYPCYSAPNASPNYLVRTHQPPEQMVDAVRKKVHEVEPGRSVFGAISLDKRLDEDSVDSRLRTLLLSFFAGSAITLACIGLYGTLNYLTRMRQREVGLRLALGETRRQIVVRFLRLALRSTALGCGGGLLLSVSMRHLIASMLFGVSALDPMLYFGVFSLVIVVTTASSAVPAFRAARIQPTEALRHT